MTDDKVAESAQEQPEVEEQPKPRAPSAPSGDKPTSQPKAGSDDLGNLEAKVDSILSRREQSFKDKRIAELTKKVDRLATLLEESGGEPASQPDPGRSSVAEPEDDSPSKIMEAISEQVLSGKGIAFDDAEYEAFVDEHAWVKSPENWRTLLQAWADRQSTKVAKQESATMASRVTSGGSPSPVEGDAETVAEQLAAIQRGEHGSPFSPENQNRINELIAKLDELEPQVDVNDPNLHIDTSALYKVV